MSLLQVISFIAYFGIVFYILRQVDFSAWLKQGRFQHIVFGSCASLFILWLFRTGIYDGLDVHFLWLAALTLLLGFRWAIISASLAMLGCVLVGMEPWQNIGVTGLAGVVVPISISYAIYALSFHKLPKHFFIYVFVCGFFGGMAALGLKMATLAGYFWLADIHDWQTIVDNYLILIPLLLFPEGLLNGMSMTMLIIYKPDWVYTFHDKFYLDGK
ncbi:MAG: energy-coupling factor ABC transporter permease [Aestuariibacter sp.]